MAAYVIFQAEVTDDAQYARYRDASPASVSAAGGRFIVRGGETALLEGDEEPGRTVIIEFPDRRSALEWYHGKAYTDARALREGAASGRMYVVDGVD